MKIQAKDLKIGDVFTETGLTVKVVNIKRDDLKNKKEGYNIEVVSIGFNSKIYPKNTKIGLNGFYWKKAETFVSIK